MRWTATRVPILALLLAAGCSESKAPAGSDGGDGGVEAGAPDLGPGTDGKSTLEQGPPADGSEEQTVCSGVDCSGHGSCEVVDDEPQCSCDLGYESSGTECAPLSGWFGVAGSELGPWSVRLDSADSGGGLSASTRCDVMQVAVDSAGVPVAVWDDPLRYRVYAARFDPASSSWQQLGQPDSATALLGADVGGTAPALALTPAGEPVVAWRSVGVYVKRWDGTSWQALGTSASGSGLGAASIRPDIVVGSDGNPVVAWAMGAGLRVSRWDGGAWIEMASLSGGGEVRVVSLALDAQGHPAIAWERRVQHTSYADGHVQFMRWDGSAWSSSTVDGGWGNSQKTGASLTFDREDNPVVAYEDAGASTAIRVRRKVGSAWESVGPAVAAQGTRPVVATDPAGDLWLSHGTAYGSAGLAVRRWDGMDWTAPLGQPSPSSIRSVSLAFESSSSPVVGWLSDFSGVSAAYVRRHDGTGWVGYGPTITAQGLSDEDTSAQQPQIAMADDRSIHVTWASGSGSHTFRTKALQAGGWTALPDLSGSAHPDARSGLAMDSAGTLHVFWHEGNSSSVAIWDGTAWDVTKGPVDGNMQFGWALVADSPVIAHTAVKWPTYWLSVRRLTTSWTWEHLDGIGSVYTGDGQPRGVSLAGDASGRAAVAWYGGGSQLAGKLQVKIFNGTGWTSTTGELGQCTGRSALAIDSGGAPWIAWRGGGIYVKRYDGTQWLDLDGSATASGLSGTDSWPRPPRWPWPTMTLPRWRGPTPAAATTRSTSSSGTASHGRSSLARPPPAACPTRAATLHIRAWPSPPVWSAWRGRSPGTCRPRSWFAAPTGDAPLC